MIEITVCPRCGAELEAGHINGQMKYLMWSTGDEGLGVTTLGEEHLATGTFTKGPRVPASRCRACGLGLFEVDPDPTPEQPPG